MAMKAAIMNAQLVIFFLFSLFFAYIVGGMLWNAADNGVTTTTWIIRIATIMILAIAVFAAPIIATTTGQGPKPQKTIEAIMYMFIANVAIRLLTGFVWDITTLLLTGTPLLVIEVLIVLMIAILGFFTPIKILLS